MPPAFELQTRIHSQVADYVADRITLHEFLDRFMDTAEDVYETGDPALAEFVNTIKLYWAEYTNGDHTEDGLRALLSPFVDTYRASYAVETPPSITQVEADGSKSVQVQRTFEYNPTSVESAEDLTRTVHQETSSLTDSWHESLAVVDKTQRDTRQELVVRVPFLGVRK